MIGPTDGNLHALRQREAERDAAMPRFEDCYECNGTGKVMVPLGMHTGDSRLDDWDEAECPECGGTGEIEVEDEE